MTADNDYFSKENVKYLAQEQTDGYVATGRIKHKDQQLLVPRVKIPNGTNLKQRMSQRLPTLEDPKIYRKRGQISESAFVQIKQARGFRQFLLRGL